MHRCSGSEDNWKKRFEVKTKVIGTGEGEVSEARVLSRIIRVSEQGWEYEGDQRHAELIVKALSLENAKSVSTPSEDQKIEREETDLEDLDSLRASEYRQLAARANFMTLDRADTQYAVKEICRGMARPTVGHWRRLKRLGRYLRGRPRVVSLFRYQARGRVIDGYSDSDWAGCRRTARSTSGGATMPGSHEPKSWSATQKNVTLSSAEAELVAAVGVCGGCIGITQLAIDWGIKLRGRVHIDSSAAIGVAHRRGNGKLRHVRVGTLWIQELVEEGEIEVRKVLGARNVADALTKNVPATSLDMHLETMGFQFRDGRAVSSLTIP